jgi:hypothetical protein
LAKVRPLLGLQRIVAVRPAQLKQCWLLRSRRRYNPDMSDSLLPERPLLLSPSLAATLGLEEALLLQALDEPIRDRGKPGHDGYRWLDLPVETLERMFPFWSRLDCQRVLTSLRDKGVLLIDSPPLAQAEHLRCAINQRPGRQREAAAPRRAEPTPGKTLLAPGWHPDEELLRQLEINGVPRAFAPGQLPEFIAYWRDRGESAFSWSSKFRSQVLRRWREREADDAAPPDRAQPMSRDWQPHEDAFDLLEQGAIPRAFAEDCVAEFVLYWCERGDASRTWNSRFVTHVKRQWARCQHALQQDSEPRPMAADWQPAGDVFDILRLANIDLAFARDAVAEFVLYWRERGELSAAWNSKFLQHVKHQWARGHHLRVPGESGHETGQGTDRGRSTRHTSLADDLNDRSWAR